MLGAGGETTEMVQSRDSGTTKLASAAVTGSGHSVVTALAVARQGCAARSSPYLEQQLSNGQE